MRRAASQCWSLQNNDCVAVVGGGPAGSFFAIYLLREARRLNRRIEVVIVETRSPINMGAAALECRGCGFCAGGISPRLDEILEQQGLSVPDEIVQGRFDYVWIQGQWKNFRLRVPKDKRMYSVFRGSLPGRRSGSPAGFDGFLLGEAVKEGAHTLYGTVEAMAYGASGLPRLTVRTESGERVPLDASFVTIATGINAHCGRDYRDDSLMVSVKRLNPAFVPGRSRKAFIFELDVGEDYLERNLRREIYFIEYGSKQLALEHTALVPKGRFLTVAMRGKCIDEAILPRDSRQIIHDFLTLPQIERILPGIAAAPLACACAPRMTVTTARSPFGDRFAIIGDAVGSRLNKDGLFSAHVTASRLAQTVLQDGIDLNEGGGSWNRDGTILFVPDEGALYKVTGAGANPLPVLANDPNKVFVKPRFLPDGKHFLIASDSRDPAARGTYFASLDGRESRLVVGGNVLAIYASGFLLYVKGNTLMAQAFEPERGQLKGDPPQRVVDRVARAGNYFANTIDATENGILIYRTIGDFDQKRLTWFDRAGKNQGVTGDVGDYWDVRLSPDGQKLASNAGNRYSDIWVDDLARAVRTRLTIDPDTDHGIPVWSPDGSRIAFAVLEGKIRRGIYQKHSNGAGGEELLLADSDKSIWPTSWSRDGRFLLYSREAARQEDSDIWVLPMAGDRRSRPFVQVRERAYDGEFSPDGRWMAYTSEESGRGEVYVVPFRASSLLTTGPGPASAGAGGRWQVSASGGRSPRWRRDGKEIFYLSQANQIMAAEVEEKGNSMIVRAARALFRCTPVPSLPSSAPYDVSPDGQKFVINRSEEHTSELQSLRHL